MKKILITILSLILIFNVVGCVGSNQDNKSKDNVETENNSTEDEKTIFFTNAILTSPYCAIQLEAMNDYAEENNINLQVADGKEDAQTQLDQIKNAVTQGVDGIIYFPGDQASTVPVVRYLAESEVPFIVLNSQVDDSVQDLVPSYVGSDYTEMGRVAGELTNEILGEEGGNIVLISGLSGTEVSNSTEKGFMEEIASNKNINILANQAGDWDTAKAMTIMEDYLTTFGGKIDLVFSFDGGMAKGVAQALENSGLWGEIPVVSSDQAQFVLDAIANGDMVGTAKQDPFEEGVLAMGTIIRLVNGENVEKWEKVPTGKITQENVEGLKGY